MHGTTFSPVLFHLTPLLIIPKINNRLLKLPRGHLPIKQNIRLSIRPVFQLRQTEERNNPAYHGGTAPHIATLARKIPAGRIQHLRSEIDHGDLSGVVSSASDTRAEGAQTDGGGFGDGRVGDGAEGAGEDEGDDDAEAGLRVVGGCVLGDAGADAEEEEEGYVDSGAPEVDCSTAEVSC